MNSTATISNVHFLENKAHDGEAIFASDFCEITIFNISFVSSTGSAIYIVDGVSLQIDHCNFSNNSAGSLFALSSSVYSTNSVFSQNTEGALFIKESSEATFYNCTFADNSAFEGGALYVFKSNIQLITCTFSGNSATKGGVFVVTGNLLLLDCTMNKNSATGDGGVGYLEDNSQINIKTSRFNLNSANGSGGVLQIRKATVNVWNSTFAKNRAQFSGGVIDAQYFSLINISGTKFLGNTASRSGVLYGSSSTKVYMSD